MTVGTCVVAGVSVQAVCRDTESHQDKRSKRARGGVTDHLWKLYSFVKIAWMSVTISMSAMAVWAAGETAICGFWFFCFRTERKKESNWENITIMILSSLHPSVSYSTSLASHSLSVPYISCFYSSTAFTLTSHFNSSWVLNSQWGWDEFSRFHFTSTLFQEFAWEKWYLVMCRELILLSSQEQVKLHRKQAGQALLVSPVRIRSKIWGN